MSRPSLRRSGQALFVVISSPSGGGKTTVIGKLLKRNPDFRRSVSVTTRPRRPGEAGGRDYYFVTPTGFRRIIRRKGFLEWAEVYGNLYGTPQQAVDKAFKHGWTVLFSLDTQGALAVKKKYPQAVLIFLLPPSWEELKKRLLSRESDSRQVLKVRLKNAKKELQAWKKYDYIVVNKEFSDTIKQIESIIQAEKCKVTRAKSAKLNLGV